MAESRVQRSEREWSRIVGRWRRSGMSAAKFAAQQGVGQSSLHKWARRFRCPPAVAFDEVGVAGAVSTSLSEPASIEITTRNGYLLRVGAGVNAAVLRSVLSAVANC